MGLTSALTTALTGLSAAETQIDVIGNNLANSQTVGFKSSDVIFGTQFLQTLSLGRQSDGEQRRYQPSPNRSRRPGRGNRREPQPRARSRSAAVRPIWRSKVTVSLSSRVPRASDSTRGTGSSNSTAMPSWSTRRANDCWDTVSTTSSGLQESQLVPLSVPLGTESVAKATENVTFEGSLTPVGELATVSQVIESVKLGRRPGSAARSVRRSARRRSAFGCQ